MDQGELKRVATIEEKIILSFSNQRLVKGILHDKIFKHWSHSLLEELQSDLKISSSFNGNSTLSKPAFD